MAQGTPEGRSGSGGEVHLVFVLSLSRAAHGCSAELSRSFGSASKQGEIGPESFGIVVCRSVVTVPGIGLGMTPL